MTNSDLLLKANWAYGQEGARSHYLVEAWLSEVLVGRAHGWFEPAGTFVMEKIELDEAVRSKGYGSAMIEALRLQARVSGCSELVFKGVRPDNHGAMRLYAALGATQRATPDGLYSFVLAPP